MCSKSRAVDLVCLSWYSKTYVSIEFEEIYSGACPVRLLYAMRQVQTGKFLEKKLVTTHAMITFSEQGAKENRIWEY